MSQALKIIALSSFVLGLLPTSLAVNVDSPTETYQGKVNSILEWITDKQAPTAGTGIDDWNNANNTASKTDCVAIFRLVTNGHADLTTTTSQTNQILRGPNSESLATYYNMTSDGNGTSSTGFLSEGSNDGFGSNDFLYVGGGSTAWETAQGLTPGTFLSATKRVTHVYTDGAVLLTMTVRGKNPDDLGADSDLTEAPEVGSYTATFVLRATHVTH